MKKLTFLGLALALASASNAALADGAAKFLGNITTGGQVRSDFGEYWNQITAENECKWASIEGTRGNYNFRGCDAAYNWAKQNNGHFKFHALVWGGQYPSWLNGLSADETRKAITAWFDAVAKHYPDLEMIDVVNEAIRTSPGKYHSPYGVGNNIVPALGGDNNDYNFVTTAFKMARERWPKAILIYNDYNTVQWHKDQGIDLINTIKKNGAPVDAYGLQAHDMMSEGGGAGGTGGGGKCYNINNLKNIMNEIYQKTKLPLFISEYDIATTDDNIQKQCYSEQISFFMEAEYVAGITLWGYVYGRTWLDCNGTAGGCSGIIKDGRDRAAMTWMKEYFKTNKGVNTTGLATGDIAFEPEPSTPFKNHVIPGKIEAEDFDIPGKGRGNEGYSDNDTENHGDSDYRKDTGVDIYKKATGNIVGYNQTGEFLTYTVNIDKAGDYTMFAAVASANNTSSFQLSLDDKVIVDKVSVPQASSGEDNYDDYNKVSAKVTLPQGKHTLKLTVTGDWFDIDYLTFVAGDNATDPEPIVKETQFIENIHMNSPVLARYDIFDMQGVFMGRISAYSASEAVEMLKTSSEFRNSGNYYLRNRTTGKMEQFRIAR